MNSTTHDLILRQVTIAQEALAELPNAKRDSNACAHLRNQLALALSSIAALVERERNLGASAT